MKYTEKELAAMSVEEIVSALRISLVGENDMRVSTDLCVLARN